MEIFLILVTIAAGAFGFNTGCTTAGMDTKSCGAAYHVERGTSDYKGVNK